MKTIYKTVLSLLLLCLLGAAWKGYGQEVEPGTVLWKSNIGTNRFYLSPSLSVDEKLVFVANSHTGRLIAYYTENGNKAWELDSVKSGNFTPIIKEDSFIFAFKDSYIGEFNIDELSKNWELEVGRVQPFHTHRNIALSRNGDIVTISNNSKLSHINSNGQLINDFTYEAGVDSIIYGPENYVYFWNRSELTCLNVETKKIVWKEKLSDKYGGEGNSPPVLNSKGELIARFLYNNEESKIIKYKGKTGWKVWEYPSEKKFGKYETPTAISIGINDEIIATTRGGKLFKLNDAGQEIWSFQGDNGSWSVPAISQKGSVYYGTSSKTFFCIDYENGKEKWKLNLGLSTTDPVITKSGLVLFGANDGNLYAVQGDSAPMDSAWPMGGQNPQRTNSSQLTIFPDQPDLHQPVITLIGDPIISVVKGGSIDLGQGAKALDDVDGDLTSKIVVSGTYDVNTVGTYELTYDVEDSSGKKADKVNRTIHIVDKATVTTNKKTYWPGETIKVKYSGASDYPLLNNQFLKIKIKNLVTNKVVYENWEPFIWDERFDSAYSTFGEISYNNHWRNELAVGKYKVELFGENASDEFTVVPQVLWESKLTDVSSASLAISNNGDLIAMSQNKTFSINPKNGSVNWESEKGGTWQSDPVIDQGGKIYIPSYKIDILDGFSGASTLDGGVEIKGGDIDSWLTLYDESKFITRLTHPKRGIRMVNHNGKTIWEYSTENEIYRSIIIGGNGDVYGVSSGIFCLNGTTGEQKWVNKEINGSFAGGMAIGINNDLLFLVSYSFNQKNLVSLNATNGELNWQHNNVERYGSISLDHGQSLVIDNEGFIHVNAYNDMGASQNFSLVNSINGSLSGQTNDQYWSTQSPILLSDESRLIKASEALICEDIESGEQLWAYKYPAAYRGYSISSLTLNEAGNIYLYLKSNYNSSNNKLVALSGNASLADAPWPMNAQNPQNTSKQPAGPIKLTKNLPEKIFLREGASTSLIVRTDGGFPKQWQWFLNGELLKDERSQFLKLSNVTSNHEGVYSVTITNALGSQESRKCYVRVLEFNSPRVYTDDSEVFGRVLKGGKAVITLSTSYEGGSIYYTLDGSDPSFQSTLYKEPFSVTESSVVRALAYSKDFSKNAEADPVLVNIVNNYTLQTEVSGQGSITTEPQLDEYIQDSVVNLKAVPAEGWRFAGWSGALQGSYEKGSVVMDSNKAVTARFNEITQNKIELVNSGGGLVNGLKFKGITGPIDYRKNLLIDCGYLLQDFTKIENPEIKQSYIKIKKFSNFNCPVQVNVNSPTDSFGGVWRNGNLDSFSTLGYNINSIENVSVSIRIENEQHFNINSRYDIESIELQIKSNNDYYYWQLQADKELEYLEIDTLALKAISFSGFSFLNWAGDVSGTNPNVTLNTDRDKTVEAVFGTSLSTTATGSGKLILDLPNGPYPYGSKVKITPVPDNGFYLGVWGADAAGEPTGPIEYEITKANPEITALFVPLEANKHVITVLPSKGGQTSSSPNASVYTNGDKVTITASAAPGYSFSNWSGDVESSDNPISVIADANKTIQPIFTPNVFAPVILNTESSFGGNITRTPVHDLYEKGSTVKLEAIAKTGYKFVGWSGDISGEAASKSIELTEDKTVKADFKPLFKMVVETTGPGSVISAPEGTSHVEGTQVVLTASPQDGYAFSGWSGDLETSSQQASITVDSNKKIVANFTKQGSLSTFVRGQGTVTKSPDKETYLPGEKVTLTAQAAEGFEFSGWGENASNTSATLSVVIGFSSSVIANFKDTQSPTVTITSPNSDSAEQSKFTLSGAVSDNGKIKSLVWLKDGEDQGKIKLSDGKFELKDQKLSVGENKITVVATDRSGNEGTATVAPVWKAKRTVQLAESNEVIEGRRVNVPIEVVSEGKVGGMSFVIEYDPKYLTDPILNWSTLSGLSLNQINTNTVGQIDGTFALAGNAIADGKQLIGTATFRARSVPKNLSSPLALGSVLLSDKNGEPITSGTEIKRNEVKILKRSVLGDNNGNSRLDIGDAIRIQRLLVGKDTVRPWDVASNDLNNSSDLDPGDVVKLLLQVVNKSKETTIKDTPPKFVQVPKSQNVQIGQSVKLEGKATASTKVRYQWYRNGRPVPGKNAPVLSFSSIQQSQIGMYRLLARTSTAAVLSPPAFLRVGSDSGGRNITKASGEAEAHEGLWLSLKKNDETTITVSAELKAIASGVAGAKFQLEYPADILVLKDKQSHQAGELVPEKLKQSIYWKVEADEQYDNQKGNLTFALSDSEPWAESDGELAKFEFEVKDAGKLDSAVLKLSRAEISPSGYDNRLIQGSALKAGLASALEVDYGFGETEKEEEKETEPDKTNQAPVLAAIEEISMTAGESKSFAVSYTDSDANDTHTINLSSDAIGVTVSESGTEYTVSAAEDFEGPAMITVKVSDGQDSDVTTFKVSVAPKQEVAADSFGDPKVYPNNSFSVYGTVTIEGSTASVGDVVAAYVDGELRGKQTIEYVIEDTAYLTLQVYVQESGEVLNQFKIWDKDTNTTLDLSKQIVIEPGGQVGSATSLTALDFKSTVVQKLSLKEGWNLVSFYVEAEDMTPAKALEPIKDKLAQIKNLTSSYDPSLPFFLNTLNSLNVKDGYWLKISESADLEIEGTVPEGASITVKTGWNLVGYPRENGAAPASELASLGNTIGQIKNLTSSYDPSLPFFLNTLNTMVPGQGYWLKVTENGTWTLGKTDSGQGREITKMSPEKWGEVVVYPNLTATVLAEVTLNGKPVSEGSMVAAFVGEELRGKREVVLSEGKSYGTLNVNLDGTEQVRFRIWEENLGKEFEVADSMSLEIGKTYGTATALVQLDGAASSKVEIIGLSRAPFGFSFKTDKERNYEVEASFDLKKWNLLRQIKGTGEEEKFIDFRRAFYPRQYYRVKETE